MRIGDMELFNPLEGYSDRRSGLCFDSTMTRIDELVGKLSIFLCFFVFASFQTE